MTARMTIGPQSRHQGSSVLNTRAIARPPRDSFVSQRLFLGRVKLRTLSCQPRAVYARNLFLDRLLNDMASVGKDARPHQPIDPLQKRLIYRDSYLCDTHSLNLTFGHTPGQASEIWTISLVSFHISSEERINLRLIANSSFAKPFKHVLIKSNCKLCLAAYGFQPASDDAAGERFRCQLRAVSKIDVLVTHPLQPVPVRARFLCSSSLPHTA